MTTSITTLKLPAALKRRLAPLARRTGQTPHAWMIDALAERVEREEARLAFVKAASEAADGIDRGDPVFEMQEIHAWLRAKTKGRSTRRPSLQRRAAR
jgi:predicted transcriptional regulator